jgi:hypothetical protein
MSYVPHSSCPARSHQGPDGYRKELRGHAVIRPIIERLRAGYEGK